MTQFVKHRSNPKASHAGPFIELRSLATHVEMVVATALWLESLLSRSAHPRADHYLQSLNAWRDYVTLRT